MLARYMPWPCVRHKSAFYIETAERIELALARELDLTYPTSCHLRKFGYTSETKGTGTSLRNFAPNSGLRKISPYSKSIVLSTILVDGRACRSHLRQSTRSCWMHIVYCTSVDGNPLKLELRYYIVLFWICCTTCSYSCAAVDEILTDALRYYSRAFCLAAPVTRNAPCVSAYVQYIMCASSTLACEMTGKNRVQVTHRRHA